MAKSIARQALGSRPGIGRRQIGGRSGQANLQEPYSYAPGSYTFTAPKAGYWKFVAWGAGFGGGANGGSAGALSIITRFLGVGQAVAVVVGAAAVSGAGADSTLTFAADGKLVTAGGGTGQNGSGAGVASGGDVNTNGGLGGAANGGDAPSNGNYRGGLGGVGGNNPGSAPGGGGSQAGLGGSGLVLAVFIRT